jgi:hypothetical protein
MVKIEILTSLEAYKLVSLIYTSYGSTYPKEEMYDEHKLVHLIDSGNFIPIVAKDQQGNVVGLLIIKHLPFIYLYYAGIAVVHPEFRGNYILSQLMNFSMDFVRQNAHFGFYGEPIAINSASQKSSILSGGKETGFFLGRIPPYVKFQSSEINNIFWINSMLFFYPACNLNGLTINAISTKYTNVIEYIGQYIGIKEIKWINDHQISYYDNVNFMIDPAWQTAELLVENLTTLDKNFWRQQLFRLQQQPVRAVYLNLSHPHINDWLEILWQHKYFFAGIIPYFFKTGSALVMQQATDLPYSKNNQFATSFGRQIYEWCMADRERVLSLS